MTWLCQCMQVDQNAIIFHLKIPYFLWLVPSPPPPSTPIWGFETLSIEGRPYQRVGSSFKKKGGAYLKKREDNSSSYLNCFNVYIFVPYAFYFSYSQIMHLKVRHLQEGSAVLIWEPTLIRGNAARLRMLSIISKNQNKLPHCYI